MYVYAYKDYYINCEGDFDVDPYDFCEFLEGKKPTEELLLEYLESKINPCNWSSSTCDLEITASELKNDEVSDYEELFEEVRRIQAEEED